ncbi:Probable RNA-directed DNA polymerase from transposon BS [Eumeta japonica]|uniref:Probable RNA-directed DNA polymerase from transposon BS n=1 Tax=Eumeta variegata TaxID=151549 RepID=A0A4C1VRC4_EUMVA|nr:Probable RNA-directed DNA polymerase from transposon BS [Eumeta japonica]
MDSIGSKALKLFSVPHVALLVVIFNACIKNCYFPTTWKEAVVIGILKPGKLRDLPASYRPISLLSILGKLFEKPLKTRLNDHIIEKDLIINKQFGFRPNHSCPQQALRLVAYILEEFKIKKKAVEVFFDVAKTFDRVWHAGQSHADGISMPEWPSLNEGVKALGFRHSSHKWFRSCTPTATYEARAEINIETLSIILPTHRRNPYSEATVKGIRSAGLRNAAQRNRRYTCL